MKIFTDKIETSFFKTDNYVKGLHAIEINSIVDFVLKYSFDPMILLGVNSLMVTRFDELVSGNPVVDNSDEPELHGEWVDIDFVADMNTLDILQEITEIADVDDDFLKALKSAGVISGLDTSWVDDDNQIWIISAQNDTRQLRITDSDTELTSDFFEPEAVIA